jgi:L-serine deaminase
MWRWDQVLKTHPNGMRFSCFGHDGDLLATNEYFSVGGGFVVNEKTKVGENLFYKGVDKRTVHEARLHQGQVPDQQSRPGPSIPDPQSEISSPPFPFTSGDSLLTLTRTNNMTIAQIVYENERSFGLSEQVIHNKLMQIWQTMDECIKTGVATSETTLPGRLHLQRRAPQLYRRLMRGFYPGTTIWGHTSLLSAQTTDSIEAPSEPVSALSRPSMVSQAPKVVGSLTHTVPPMPPRKAQIPAVDFLSCYAIAVNEVNASGGRIVTSPTNGAAGVIPAVLKYVTEFITDESDRTVSTFLLTAAAIGMLFKRGSTISAAEGGCQAEVGVACSMAAAGFAACMGAAPEIVLQAAEIGIEHNLGLTCDPIDGLVQVPCIERNSLGGQQEFNNIL